MRGPTKKQLEEDFEILLDLLEDILAECEQQGCVLSAAICERVDEWLEPPEDGEEDVLEVIPEK